MFGITGEALFRTWTRMNHEYYINRIISVFIKLSKIGGRISKTAQHEAINMASSVGNAFGPTGS